MSMFDDMDQMIQDGIVDTVAHQLFDDWIGSHLDEGVIYADYNVCLVYGAPELKQEFNEYYKLTPDHELYFEVN